MVNRILRAEAGLLDLLDECLSKEEVRRVLAGALMTLDTAGRERLIQRLGEETGASLRRVLDTDGSGGKQGRQARKSEPSTNKVREQWDRAWEDWNECIYETCYEEGRYVAQDYDWDPPYVDLSDLADDLGTIAARMEKILPRVAGDRLDPEFSFIDALTESMNEIGSGLPEWFQGAEWDGVVGPEVTSCLLRWEWLNTHRSDEAPVAGADFGCIDTVRRAEASAEKWDLDSGALVEFALGLDDPAQREILAGMEENGGTPRWKTVLDQAGSGWFALYKELSLRQAPDRHIALCRERIAGDWTLALPVLEDILARGAFTEAKPVIGEAVRSLLRLDEGEAWSPTETLIIGRPALRFWRRQRREIPPFLRLWSKIAEGAGSDETTHALRIQAQICGEWENWDPILDTLAEAASSGFCGLADRLFGDWKRIVTGTSGRTPASTWVPLLMDAARAGGADPKAFRNALLEWLDQVGSSADAFQEARPSLDVLTLDLDRESNLYDVSPALHGALAAEMNRGSELRTSRRRWLERLGALDLFPEVMALWKLRAEQLVPDPAGAYKSDYGHCAKWIAVVFELNRDAYESVLSGWRKAHRRRRNLWEAISKLGLPPSQ